MELILNLNFDLKVLNLLWLKQYIVTEFIPTHYKNRKILKSKVYYFKTIIYQDNRRLKNSI